MFVSDLDLRKGDGKKMSLLSPLIWDDGETVYIVPVDYVTDGASVPKPLWWFCSPYAGNHLKPAVLHDYMSEDEYGDQKLADQVFLKTLEANGVGWFKRHAMHKAVVAFQKFIKGAYKCQSC